MRTQHGKQNVLQRQLSVQRKNLVNICRLIVKTLIDKACLTAIDDDCEELLNFSAVLENILSHRIKPQKTWYGVEEPRAFWDYIQGACKGMPHSCISSISSLENVKSARAKGRAWIRCVLMEKRLSEYLGTALQQTNITRSFYKDGAILLSEEAGMLSGVLLGLNAIDFNFCLKGDNFELAGLMEVDYTPYMKFQQSDESQAIDQEELQVLSMQSSTQSVTSSILSEELGQVSEEESTWKHKYRQLDTKYKSVSEQKGYLEELVRLRENQLEAAQAQRVNLMKVLQQFEADSKKERQQLEGVILELQGQILGMKKKQEKLQQNVIDLMTGGRSRGGKQERHVMMEDLSGGVRPSTSTWLPTTQTPSESDQQSFSSFEGPVLQSASNTGTPSHHHRPDDSQSMVPLTGSIKSQQSILSSDSIILSGTRSSTTGYLPEKDQSQGHMYIDQEGEDAVKTMVPTDALQSTSDISSSSRGDTEVKREATFSSTGGSEVKVHSSVSSEENGSASSIVEVKTPVFADGTTKDQSAEVESELDVEGNALTVKVDQGQSSAVKEEFIMVQSSDMKDGDNKSGPELDIQDYLSEGLSSQNAEGSDSSDGKEDFVTVQSSEVTDDVVQEPDTSHPHESGGEQ